MITLEPLTEDHLAKFPLPGLPLDFWGGKAIAAVERRTGNVLGICGARLEGDTAYVGMILTDELRRKPLFLCKACLRGIEGLRRMGIKSLHARAETQQGARWLERMGFYRHPRSGDSWYVKCLV